MATGSQVGNKPNKCNTKHTHTYTLINTHLDPKTPIIWVASAIILIRDLHVAWSIPRIQCIRMHLFMFQFQVRYDDHHHDLWMTEMALAGPGRLDVHPQERWPHASQSTPHGSSPSLANFHGWRDRLFRFSTSQTPQPTIRASGLATSHPPGKGNHLWEVWHETNATKSNPG